MLAIVSVRLGHRTIPLSSRSGTEPDESYLAVQHENALGFFALLRNELWTGGRRGRGDWECSIRPIRPIPTSWCRCGRLPASRRGHRRAGSSAWSAIAGLRNLTAAYELIARAGLTHERPPFGIDSVMVGNREVAVTEEAADVTPFGTLLHFKKDIEQAQPRVLLVAPLSGHFATLLRSTVRTMLPEHDVYITDWHNARDVRSSTAASASTTMSSTSDPLPRDDRAGRACGGGVPAVRRGAGRGGRDGAGRQSGRSRAA